MLHQQIATNAAAVTATESALAAIAGHSLQVDMGGNRRNPKLWAACNKNASGNYFRIRHPRNPTGLYFPTTTLAGTDDQFIRLKPALPLVSGENLAIRAMQSSGGNLAVDVAIVLNYNGTYIPTQEPKDMQSAYVQSAAAVAATYTRGISNIFGTAGMELPTNHKFAITRVAALGAATTKFAALECPEWDGLHYPVPVVSTAHALRSIPPLAESMQDIATFTSPSPIHFNLYDQAGVTQPFVFLEVAQLD